MVAATVAVGCGNTENVLTSGAVPNEPPPVDVRAALAPEAQRFALVLAEQVLISECMQERGFKYDVISPADLDTSNRWNRLEDVYRFGPSPDDDGKDFGVVAALETAEESSPDPSDEATSTMTQTQRDAWFAAFIGQSSETYSYTDPETGINFETPVDGCTSIARIDIYDDFASYLRYSSFSLQFADTVYAAVESDPAYIEVQAAWQECMRELGSDLSQPSAAIGEIFVALSNPTRSVASIRDQERENYTLARTCVEKVDIHATGWLLVPETVSASLDNEREGVDAYRAAITRAESILESR